MLFSDEEKHITCIKAKFTTTYFFFTFQIVFSVEEIYSPQKSIKQAKLLAQKAENTWFFYFINSMLPFESDLAPL